MTIHIIHLQTQIFKYAEIPEMMYFTDKQRINKKTLCTWDITAFTHSSCSKIQVTFEQDIWKMQYRNNDHESSKFHCYKVELHTAGSFQSSWQSLIWSRHSPPFTDPDGCSHIHKTATRPYPAHSFASISLKYTFTLLFYTCGLHCVCLSPFSFPHCMSFCLISLFTYSMQQSPSWEVNWFCS